MGGKNVNQRDTPLNQMPPLEDDGGALAGHTSRENVAVIFFRRVGKAFADFGSMISRAFSNLGESFRGAFAHVSDAIRGVDSGAALRNINNGTPTTASNLSRIIDFDKDEDSEETDFVLDNSASLEQNLTSEERKKELDFSASISPTVIRKSIKVSEVISQTTNTLPKPATPEIPLAENISSFVDPEISHAEKLFEEFSEKFQASDGYASISSTDPALLDPSCLAVARRYQEAHPEHADIPYPDDVQKKRKAATALLNAEVANTARDVEKIRLEEEAKDKATELARRKSLPAGQADFEDFVSAYNSMAKPYQFAEKKIRFLSEDCIRYAQERLLQSPSDDESTAIQALLKTAGVSVQESAKLALESGVSTLPNQAVSPPPPPPSTPRWMSTLSGILKSVSESRDEMPNAFATMLMPNHGIEERNLAWNGLHLLSSPIKNLSSAVASDNEVALSYQQNSASANEDSLKRLELAGQLIKILQTLNIDAVIKDFYVIRPSDEQIDAIRRLKEYAPHLSKELESRIKVLSPAKKTTAGLISKIPTVDSLSPSAFTSASDDFNTFVKEFSSLSEQQKLQYQFVGGRAKYSRPNCAAIAQKVIASYKGLDPKDMIKVDQDRLSAAEFMISEFNKKNPST